MKWLFENPATDLNLKIRNIGLGYLVMLIWMILVMGFLQAFDLYLFSESYIFFSSCIMAPLWEEAAFRWAPITIAKKFGEDCILPVVVLSSIIFGLQHGQGDLSLLRQGVMGLVFSFLFIKNNYSYWSAVCLHAMWNLTCFTILR